MKLKDGQYFYSPHRSLWGIWIYHEAKVSEQVSYGCSTFVKDCMTKEQAREEVYRLNGWTMPPKKSDK